MRKVKKIRSIFSSCFLGLFSMLGYSQTYSPDITEYIRNVENPTSFLQKLEDYGYKGIGKPALDSSYQFLKRNVENIGYKSVTQNFLFSGETLKNIEIVKQGSLDSCIVIGAHYDSWVGAGVNDNGSGNFALFQLAKWVYNLPVKYTIRFVFFSGEEINYLGSKHYVQALNKDSVKIKCMINFDQLGGTIGEDNSAIKCEWDDISNKRTESKQIAEYMQKCYSLYTPLQGILASAYNSDYLSFRDSGYLIAGIYQNSSYPYYHTDQDLLKNMDLSALVSVVKGALAFVLSYDEATVPKAGAKIISKQNINVYSKGNSLNVLNAADSNIEVFDRSGLSIYQNKIDSNSEIIDLKHKKAGVYFVRLYNNYHQVTKKIYLEP